MYPLREELSLCNGSIGGYIPDALRSMIMKDFGKSIKLHISYEYIHILHGIIRARSFCSDGAYRRRDVPT